MEPVGLMGESLDGQGGRLTERDGRTGTFIPTMKTVKE